MIHYAHEFNVKKFISFSSVCTFADNITNFDEKMQHQGEPHCTNFGYAYAKRMLDVQMRAYEKSNTKFLNIIPANLYGPNDNFDLSDGHVIPSLIHKCYLAKKNNTSFKVWGNGTAKREFLYSEDLA